MLESPSASTRRGASVEREPATAPPLPAWVTALFEPSAVVTPGIVDVKRARAHDLFLATVVVKDALALSATGFRAATAAAYHRLLDVVARDRSLVRLWNYIPGILAPLGTEPHRYMVFNAGRHDAYERWYGSCQTFPQVLATASGIGHDGSDLVIHALAAGAPGLAIENPRQIPAYQYSRRYGPLPPCFARATLLRLPEHERPWLLVGGTSSVYGEHSAHRGELAAQVRETLLNLEALEASSREIGALGAEVSSSRSGDLACFRHLRVYHPRRVERAEVASLVEPHFPRLDSLEYVVADLCRPELLIEIEGLAHL